MPGRKQIEDQARQCKRCTVAMVHGTNKGLLGCQGLVGTDATICLRACVPYSR
jgi:hypothetical protein